MDTIKTEKEPIVAIIQSLNVGESKCYPIRRMGSVKTTVYVENISSDMKFSTKRQGNEICVTRIK